MSRIFSIVGGMGALLVAGVMLMTQFNDNKKVIKDRTETTKLVTVTLRDAPKEEVSARIVKPKDSEEAEYMGEVKINIPAGHYVPPGLYNLHAEVYCADYLQNNMRSKLDYFIWIDSGVWHTQTGQDLGANGRGYGAGKTISGYKGALSSDVPMRMTQEWINSRARTHPYLLGLNKLTQTGKSQLIVYTRNYQGTTLIKRARSVFVNTGISCGLSNEDGTGYEEDTGGVLKPLATLANGKYFQAYPLAKYLSPELLIRVFGYAANMMSEQNPVFDSIVPTQVAHAKIHKESAFAGTQIGLALQQQDTAPSTTSAGGTSGIAVPVQKEQDTQALIKALTDKVNKLEAQAASQSASAAPKVPVLAPATSVPSKILESQVNQNISGN